MIVTNHFFYSLREWISDLNDTRNPSYITYAQADLAYMSILKNVCGQYTMREMEEYHSCFTDSCGTKRENPLKEALDALKELETHVDNFYTEFQEYRNIEKI